MRDVQAKKIKFVNDFLKRRCWHLKNKVL